MYMYVNMYICMYTYIYVIISGKSHDAQDYFYTLRGKI